MKKKLKEWLKRYLVAEILGILFALIFSNLSMFFLGSIIISGFVGTWSENLGFYGTMVIKDLKKKRKKKGFLTIKDYFVQVRNMLVEFGPAEYLDSFLIRPFYLIFLTHVMSNYSLAILIGTILADITYYIPTIISYEFRKKIFKE